MEKTILHGNIYIIPNSLQICDSVGEYPHDVENVRGPQVCFRGRITSEECDNWCWQRRKEFAYEYIKDLFPVEMFMGKREGDTVELTLKGRKVVLKCLQLPCEYGRKKFEELLYDLTQSFGGVCPDFIFEPPLSRDTQRVMFIANHKKYCESMGFEIKEPMDFRYYKTYTNAV